MCKAGLPGLERPQSGTVLFCASKGMMMRFYHLLLRNRALLLCSKSFRMGSDSENLAASISLPLDPRKLPGPKPAICAAKVAYSITSSARATSVGGHVEAERLGGDETEHADRAITNVNSLE